MAHEIDVLIVGAGHNGLVAAYYLAKAGLKVEVLERRSFAGGGAVTEELWPGFHFSTCAHVVHGVHPKLMRDFRFYERGFINIPRPFHMFPQPDDTYWSSDEYSSQRNLTARLTSEEREQEKQYLGFFHTLCKIFAPYRLGPPPSLEQLRARIAGTPAKEVLERAMTSRMSEIKDHFLKTDFLKEKRAEDRSAVLRDPLGLCVAYDSINYPEEETGEHPPTGYVRGGMKDLTRVLLEAGAEVGVKVHLDHPVAQLIVEDGHAIGAKLENGEEIRAKAILSNLDPKLTFLRLIAPEHLEAEFRERIDGLVSAISCMKFFGVISEFPRWKAWDGDPDLPGTGCVMLGISRKCKDEAYEDLEAGRPPRMPIISFNIPSEKDPTITQPGYHTVSCFIYPAASALATGTWDDVREEVCENLVSKINDYAPNFRDSLIHATVRTPQDIARENNMTDGCIWHVQHTGEQMFWNRPLPDLADYRAPLQGLYLCGSGQHPGGEISGVPGHNAAHEILKDLGINE